MTMTVSTGSKETDSPVGEAHQLAQQAALLDLSDERARTSTQIAVEFQPEFLHEAVAPGTDLKKPHYRYVKRETGGFDIYLHGASYKTKICPWHSRGRCRRGAECNFAHSSAELNPPPFRFWIRSSVDSSIPPPEQSFPEDDIKRSLYNLNPNELQGLGGIPKDGGDKHKSLQFLPKLVTEVENEPAPVVDRSLDYPCGQRSSHESTKHSDSSCRSVDHQRSAVGVEEAFYSHFNVVGRLNDERSVEGEEGEELHLVGNEEAVKATPFRILCYKTKFCPWFLKGRCNRGKKCNFAHSYDELKPWPTRAERAWARAQNKSAKYSTNGEMSLGRSTVPHKTIPPDSTAFSRDSLPDSDVDGCSTFLSAAFSSPSLLSSLLALVEGEGSLPASLDALNLSSLAQLSVLGPEVQQALVANLLSIEREKKLQENLSKALLIAAAAASNVTKPETSSWGTKTFEDVLAGGERETSLSPGGGGDATPTLPLDLTPWGSTKSTTTPEEHPPDMSSWTPSDISLSERIQFISMGLDNSPEIDPSIAPPPSSSLFKPRRCGSTQSTRSPSRLPEFSDSPPLMMHSAWMN